VHAGQSLAPLLFLPAAYADQILALLLFLLAAHAGLAPAASPYNRQEFLQTFSWTLAGKQAAVEERNQLLMDTEGAAETPDTAAEEEARQRCCCSANTAGLLPLPLNCKRTLLYRFSAAAAGSSCRMCAAISVWCACIRLLWWMQHPT
jgi:hypothetical protein